ncbi:DUF305 domain-containing protein [Methylobacterium sp. WL119]|uniref:CopM family metallochaperone n=2 Tax=Methylobacterium TaxID=407 RepID=UPI0011CC6154|nr:MULTISPECIES: DUF305 domain-containing protein [unclassified Methylobacterium]TXM88760.1 DUF305 domain-containing protein [Methylobacterium sp. WL116]TXN26798.1 DUF305 domain-containing protein [Methylobacterium sp. WL93]TXN43926.1 DUF305 domain-containing protein [Methylobacterium sp. WL119]
MRHALGLLVAAFAVALAGNAMAQDHDHMHMGHSPKDSVDTPATREFKASHEQMMKNMAVPYTGDPDVDFRLQMIPHHQGAIDMAKVAMRCAKDPWSRQLAESIIVEQQREIDQMQGWLRSHGVTIDSIGGHTHIIGPNSFRSLSPEAGTRSEAAGASWVQGSGVR